MSNQLLTLCGACLCLLVSIGCSGEGSSQDIGSTPPKGVPPGSPPGTPPAGSPPTDDTLKPDPTAMPPASDSCTAQGIESPRLALRMRTASEFRHVVADLFPMLGQVEMTFSAQGSVGPFDANVHLDDLTKARVIDYQQAAEALGARAKDLGMKKVAGCQDASDTACRDAWITRVAKGAYGRALGASEHQALVGLYQEGEAQESAGGGVRYVIEAVLQSPNFLIDYEEFRAGERFDGEEIARRLARVLWQSRPDDELLRAAGRGELDSAQGIETQVRRMLEHEHAKRGLRRMILEWFHLSSLAYDLEGSPLPWESFEQETTQFVDHVLWQQGGSMAELLTARYTFVDQDLAKFYGLDEAAAGLTPGIFAKVALKPGGLRRGLLTQGAVLGRWPGDAKSVHLGYDVLQSVLCASPPDPPMDIAPTPFPEGTSARVKAENRMSDDPDRDDDNCYACHLPMEGIGLTFDPFDRFGQVRTHDEHGNTLNAQGEVFFTPDIDGVVEGPEELTQKLAISSATTRCVARHLTIYALQRKSSSDQDICLARQVERALMDHDGRLIEGLIAVLISDLFRRDTPTDLTESPQ